MHGALTLPGIFALGAITANVFAPLLGDARRLIRATQPTDARVSFATVRA